MNNEPLVDIRRFAEFSEWLKKMENIYREDEREKCAQICDERADSAEGWNMEEGGYEEAISFCEQCAAAIRARGKE